MRSPALLAPLLLVLACGGSDKEAADPSDADRARLNQACSADPVDATACATLCERGAEPSCQRLMNTCLIGNDARACLLLGQAYEREGDTTHATGAFKLACQGGQTSACDKLGSASEAAAPVEPAAPPAE